jgi:hypothetical protein
MMYQRDTLLNDLRQNVIEVHFTKVNGDNRVMRCTLQKHLLPESYQTSLEEQTQESNFHNANPKVIAAWDVQAGGWRSFRIESVGYVQVIDGY